MTVSQSHLEGQVLSLFLQYECFSVKDRRPGPKNTHPSEWSCWSSISSSLPTNHNRSSKPGHGLGLACEMHVTGRCLRHAQLQRSTSEPLFHLFLHILLARCWPHHFDPVNVEARTNTVFALLSVEPSAVCT